MDNRILDPKELEKKHVSRRELFTGSGKLIACAAGAGIVAPLILNSKPKIAKAATRAAADAWDIAAMVEDTGAETAYQGWFTNFCAYAVASGMIDQLRASTAASGLWKTLSMDAIRWAHGGVVGWGTLCGSLTGAAFVIGLATGDDTDHKTIGEAMINDLMNYYSDTALPSYSSPNQHKDGTNTAFTSISNSPLCHVSVSKWMAAAGVTDFYTAERKDRCARLSADIAKKAITMLNSWKAGTYTAAYTVAQASKDGIDYAGKPHNRPSQDNGGCYATGCHAAGDK